MSTNKIIIAAIVAVAVIIVGSIIVVRVRSSEGVQLPDSDNATAVLDQAQGQPGLSSGDPDNKCGNGRCEDGEEYSSCPMDCPPVSIQKVMIDGQDANLVWYSEFPTTAVLEYGINNDFTEKVEIVQTLTEHELKLKNLQEGEIYNVIIQSKDADGNDLPAVYDEFRM